MTIWADSEMDWYYAEGESETVKCIIRIDGSNIVLDYVYERKRFVFKGSEDGEGHYRLFSDDGSGSKYHLHRFRDDETLDGVWFEGGHIGMCRISLVETEPT